MPDEPALPMIEPDERLRSVGRRRGDEFNGMSAPEWQKFVAGHLAESQRQVSGFANQVQQLTATVADHVRSATRTDERHDAAIKELTEAQRELTRSQDRMAGAVRFAAWLIALVGVASLPAVFDALRNLARVTIGH